VPYPDPQIIAFYNLEKDDDDFLPDKRGIAMALRFRRSANQ